MRGARSMEKKQMTHSNETLFTAFMFGVVAGILLFAALLTITGSSATQMREEAVKQGHAEYFLNPETHEREWRWRKCK